MHHRDYQYDPQIVQDFFDHYYIDRGMMKWQGFFLSDHTAAIKRELRMNEHLFGRKIAEQMNENEIRKIIARVIEKNLISMIQMNYRNQNMLFEDEVIGKIIGFEDDCIHMENGESIKIDEIRVIEEVPRR